MRWMTALILSLVGIALILLGVPRITASFLMLPAYQAVSDMRHGKELEREQLERAAGYLERATEKEQSAQLYTDLGHLRLLRAIQSDPEASERRGLAAAATDAFRHALVLSPARPHPWVGLAYSRTLEGAPSFEIVALLEQSIEVGPFVSEILASRLELLLEVWPQLSPKLRRYTSRQVRYAWAHDRQGVIGVMRRTRRPEIIRLALRPVPGALSELGKAVPLSGG